MYCLFLNPYGIKIRFSKIFHSTEKSRIFLLKIRRKRSLLLYQSHKQATIWQTTYFAGLDLKSRHEPNQDLRLTQNQQDALGLIRICLPIGIT